MIRRGQLFQNVAVFNFMREVGPDHRDNSNQFSSVVLPYPHNASNNLSISVFTSESASKADVSPGYSSDIASMSASTSEMPFQRRVAAQSIVSQAPLTVSPIWAGYT
jgi:hypothetical protein